MARETPVRRRRAECPGRRRLASRGDGRVHHAGSRYGSNASIDIFSVGSASGPHSSRPVEHHGVEPLRVLAGFRRGRCRETPDSRGRVRPRRHGRARSAAAGCGCRMNVPGAHTIARLEFRRRRRGAAEFAAHHDALDVVERELAVLERFCRAHRVAGSDFAGRDVALVDQQVFEPEQPFLVIRTGEIDVGRQCLPIEARGIDVERAGRAHRPHHRQHARFPFARETSARSASGSTLPKPSMPPMS